ncbi:MAG: CocE/NonD family hydrolase [Actinomycetota bacterium]
MALPGLLGPPAQAADDPPPLAPKTTNKYTAMAQQSFLIPTRGGQVFLNLVRPNVPAGMQVPVILTYTPYSVLGDSASDSFFVPKGYARAVAHVVGTGDSGGCWDYGGWREQLSGYDLVEWLGTQPWSNGKVAMIGGSYDGTTANMVAAANAPHLATIVPEVGISQWYGYAYHDGVRYALMDPAQRQGTIIDEEGFDTPAGFDFGFGAVPPTNPTDPDFVNRFVDRVCPKADKAIHTIRGYDENPDYDGFWQERNYVKDADQLAVQDGQEISVLVQGGWRDYNVKHSESSRWFDAIPVDDPTTLDNPATPAIENDEGVPYKMMVMGQGAHGGVDAEIPFQTILHAWFDHFLYGYDTNIEDQPQSISKTNDGVVRKDASWPPPTTAPVSLFLHTAGVLSSAADGPAEAAETYVDTGRMTESDALTLKGQPNAEVLWYVSAPLTQDLRISGIPKLDLTASTEGTSTHYTPVLFDLGAPVTTTSSICTFEPAQQACTVSRGFLNARYRNGLDYGQDLTPGAKYHAVVRFIDQDWVLKAGHRIAVALMSSNVHWALSDPLRAANTIYHDAANPSSLVLPVVGGPEAATGAGL